MRMWIPILSVFMLAACVESGEQAQMVVPESARRVSLAVSNMSCSTCAPTVRRALQSVPGVYKATVDLRAQTATVYFDPARTGIPALTRATTNAGYPSRVL